MRDRSCHGGHSAKGEGRRRDKPPGQDAPSHPPAPTPRPKPGLTVWEALLALSGGNARGDGGPVPAPARETPAPVPGEDCSGRPLSPALPAESRGVSAESSGGGNPSGQRDRRGGGPSASPAPPPVLLQAEATKS